jgi:hypothetical protein
LCYPLIIGEILPTGPPNFFSKVVTNNRVCNMDSMNRKLICLVCLLQLATVATSLSAQQATPKRSSANAFQSKAKFVEKSGTSVATESSTTQPLAELTKPSEQGAYQAPTVIEDWIRGFEPEQQSQARSDEITEVIPSIAIPESGFRPASALVPASGREPQVDLPASTSPSRLALAKAQEKQSGDKSPSDRPVPLNQQNANSNEAQSGKKIQPQSTPSRIELNYSDFGSITEINTNIRDMSPKTPEDRSISFVFSNATDYYPINDPRTLLWEAPNIAYNPLYFQEIPLERYGQHCGWLRQSVLSGSHFFNSAIALPYNMLVAPPHSCVYPVGYARPGDCVPFTFERLRQR